MCLQLFKSRFLSARVDVAEISRFSAASAQALLDKLLDGGYISPASYVKRLPAGMLLNREALIEELEAHGSETLSEEVM